MKRQLEQIDAMYDWSREINTSSPEYYKWTQWIFLKMYKRGLAYRRLVPINWCPSCKTGLANEEVVNGRCERCETPVTKKNLMQWMLRITKYADHLLRDLEKVDWPEKVKTMQTNWIGYSEGAEVIFKAVSAKDEEEFDIPVFTTRPDTLFGATHMVLAPEHELTEKINSPSQEKEVQDYIERSRRIPETERLTQVRQKTGVFTGAYAINPVNSEKIPIWISDYVLLAYGTGAIMAVPAHDIRDFEFATKFHLPIREVIYSPRAQRQKDGTLKEAYLEEGELINSGSFNGLSSEKAREKITESLRQRNLGKRAVSYKLRDWVFSRQRYWGEPIPIIYCERCGEIPVPEKDLPVELPQVKKYQPSGTGKSPLENIPEFVNTTCPACGSPAKRETDTMPQWAGSSWYFLRYPNAHLEEASFEKETANYWLPVDMYVGGIEHAILHLLYSRFFTKVICDLGYIDFDEPFQHLFNQGMVCKRSKRTGKVEKMSKSKGNVVNPDDLVEKYGMDTVRLYELFIGPAELDCEWQDQGIEGVFRFLKKTWNLISKWEGKPGSEDRELQRRLHLFIRDVTERIEAFKFNTAVSSFMEFVNFLNRSETLARGIDQRIIETFLILLAPFAPHFCEELWEKLGHPQSIFQEKWPLYDPSLVEDRLMRIVVQVNGKLRGTLLLAKDTPEEKAVEEARKMERIRKYLEGKEIKKAVFVPSKIINFVTTQD